jgi:hypothetical protein
VPYEKFRLRGTRADSYLCRLCRAIQAFAWDHCHDHGHVRGPLCTSCNNVEGKAAPDTFLQSEDGALHLLQCRDCHEQRTLPRRFHLEVIRAHLKRTERHGSCHREPYVDEAEHTHGVYRFQLQCSGWHAKGTWTRNVTASEATALVEAFVDRVLAAPENTSPPPARSRARGDRLVAASLNPASCACTSDPPRIRDRAPDHLTVRGSRPVRHPGTRPP